MARRSKKQVMVTGFLTAAFNDREPIDNFYAQFDGIMEKALKAGLWYWFQVFLPRHFQVGAAQKYGYQSRSGKYQLVKRVVAKRFSQGKVPKSRDGIPLAQPQPAIVWTGRSRETATSAPARAPRMTRKGSSGLYRGVVVVKTEKHLRLNKRIDMLREMTATTVQEQLVLLEIMEQKIKDRATVPRVGPSIR